MVRIGAFFVGLFFAGWLLISFLMGAVAYVAVFPSILSYTFWNRGVDLIGANRAGLFIHLMPLFGSVMAIAFLGESPQLYHLAGAVLILIGLVIASRRKSA